MSERNEERIEAALDVLRDARAPEGVEARVMAAVRIKEAAAVRADIVAGSHSRQTSVWWLDGASRGSGRRGLFWIGATTVAALMVAMLTLAGRVPIQSRATTAGKGLTQTADVRKSGEAKVSGALVVNSAVPRTSGRKNADLGSTEMRSRNRWGKRPLEGRASMRQAEEFVTASYPAPPRPLTEEELALLSIVRSGRVEDFPMLDPSQRERASATGDAEFQKFINYHQNNDHQNEVHP